jgi:hypothetical protein
MTNDKGKTNEGKSNKPELFIDNERYAWEQETITEAQLRTLGSIPSDVQIFMKRPGQTDLEVTVGMVINLSEHPGPAMFATQPVGSQAG